MTSTEQGKITLDGATYGSTESKSGMVVLKELPRPKKQPVFCNFETLQEMYGKFESGGENEQSHAENKRAIKTIDYVMKGREHCELSKDVVKLVERAGICYNEKVLEEIRRVTRRQEWEIIRLFAEDDNVEDGIYVDVDVNTQEELNGLGRQTSLNLTLYFDADLSKVEAKYLTIKSYCELKGECHARELNLYGKPEYSNLKMVCESLRIVGGHTEQLQMKAWNEEWKESKQVFHVPDGVRHLEVTECPELEYLIFGKESKCTKLKIEGDSTNPEERWKLRIVGRPQLEQVEVGAMFVDPLDIESATHILVHRRMFNENFRLSKEATSILFNNEKAQIVFVLPRRHKIWIAGDMLERVVAINE